MSKKTEKEFFNNSYITGNRQAVGQVYSITRKRVKQYEDLIYGNVAGLRVLEYGCGTGSHSIEMARRGAEVVGIDISEIGIENARRKAAEAGLDKATYEVMDAENMTFPDASFDLVVGEGILHHLDLEKSYSEISRVLKPGGRAIFSEPLGHNPAIYMFRAVTPSLRTPDEHPLLWRDLRLAKKYFEKTTYHYHHLTSFTGLAFLKTPFFFRSVSFFDRLDSLIFNVLPPLRLLSWYAIMILERQEAEAAAE